MPEADQRSWERCICSGGVPRAMQSNHICLRAAFTRALRISGLSHNLCPFLRGLVSVLQLRNGLPSVVNVPRHAWASAHRAGCWRKDGRIFTFIPTVSVPRSAFSKTRLSLAHLIPNFLRIYCTSRVLHARELPALDQGSLQNRIMSSGTPGWPGWLSFYLPLGS